MNLDRIRELISQIEATGEDFDASPANEDAISKLETEIGRAFPPSYRLFLKEFGSIWCADQSISGIHDNDPSDDSSGSILGDTKRFREEFKLPLHLLVVQADEDAPYCLDLSSDAEEPPVVCFQLNTGTYEKIADSFESFFTQWFLEELVELCGDE